MDKTEGCVSEAMFARAGQGSQRVFATPSPPRLGKVGLRVLTSYQTQPLLPRKSLSGSNNKAPTMVTAAATKNDEWIP